MQLDMPLLEVKNQKILKIYSYEEHEYHFVTPMQYSRTFISDTIQIIDGMPILYLEDLEVLVLTDLHLGIEAIMSEDGTFSPFNQTQKQIETISEYLKAIKPKILVLNGDIKHSFHEPTKIENRDVKNFLQAISSLVSEIHITKGNHDVFLNWVVRDIPNASFHKKHYIIKHYFFTHGDKPLPAELPDEIEYVIIGHEHPVLHVNVNGFQKVRVPIFLKGPITNHKAQLIVQPSFTDYSSGTPIHPLSKANLLSPILREEVDLSLFELYALNEDKEVLHFPSLDKWL